jgi:signal transduction histidine kinase
MTDYWALYSLPTAVAAAPGRTVLRVDGSAFPTPEKCLNCRTQACFDSSRSPKFSVRECPFGFDYFWIDDLRLALGFVAVDKGLPTLNARRKARQNPLARVRSVALTRAIDAARSLPEGALEDFERNRESVIKGMIADPELRTEMASAMRKEFAEVPLQQSHDFMQFVNQIRGNVEVLLREARPDSDLFDAAESLPQLGSIFFATQLMRAKIDSLAYLQEANRIFGGERKVRLHPMVLKYWRIYQSQATAKKLVGHFRGESHGEFTCNPDALGVVIHALLDNQVKYAPAGSKIEVGFAESSDRVVISFSGLGPEIPPDERTRIFEQGYRGHAARALYADGMGIGLASASLICDALDIDLRVVQGPDQDPSHRDLFWTTFSIAIPFSSP